VAGEQHLKCGHQRREQRRPGTRRQLPQTVSGRAAHSKGHQRAIEALKARTRLVRRQFQHRQPGQSVAPVIKFTAKPIRPIGFALPG